MGSHSDSLIMGYLGYLSIVALVSCGIQGGDMTKKTSAVQGCEILRHIRPAEAKVFRIGESQLNEAGRDFNIRYCDQTTGGGGWTVIQRRGDNGDPKENFTRDWTDYKHGFGDLNGEFWFGNDYISSLTLQTTVMLRVELEAHDGRTAWAEYDTFRVEGESRTTAYGWGATPEMLRTVYPRTMGTSSPLLTGIMTRHLSAVHAPLHTGVGSGSTA